MTSPENNPTWQENLSADAAQRRETFARFGLAIYQAQCVERQVVILVATTFNPDFLRTSPEERDRFFACEFAKDARASCGRAASAYQRAGRA